MSELWFEPKTVQTQVLGMTTNILLSSEVPTQPQLPVSSLQTTKLTHWRPNQSSPENTKKILSTSTFRLCWVSGHWTQSSRERGAWRERGFQRHCSLFMATPHPPCNWLELFFPFSYSLFGILWVLNPQSFGWEKKRWKWAFCSVDFSFKFMTMWCPQEWLFSSLSP